MNRILFFAIFLLPLLGYSQRNLEIPVNHRIILNFTDRTVYADILTTGEKINPELRMVYYWYKANDIKKTRGGYDGQLLHGTYIEFYADMNLKEKGTFRYGVKHGLWKTWYPNGELASVTNWRKGKMHGKFRLYDERGAILKVGNYKNDVLDGRISTYLQEGEITERYKDGVRVEGRGFWKFVYNLFTIRKKVDEPEEKQKKEKKKKNKQPEKPKKEKKTKKQKEANDTSSPPEKVKTAPNNTAAPNEK